MAFFTRTSSRIPYLPTDECHGDTSTLTKSSKEDGSTVKSTDKNNSDKGDNKSNECTATDQYKYVVDRVLGVEV